MHGGGGLPPRPVAARFGSAFGRAIAAGTALEARARALANVPAKPSSPGGGVESPLVGAARGERVVRRVHGDADVEPRADTGDEELVGAQRRALVGHGLAELREEALELVGAEEARDLACAADEPLAPTSARARRRTRPPPGAPSSRPDVGARVVVVRRPPPPGAPSRVRRGIARPSAGPGDVDSTARSDARPGAPAGPGPGPRPRRARS